MALGQPETFEVKLNMNLQHTHTISQLNELMRQRTITFFVTAISRLPAAQKGGLDQTKETIKTLFCCESAAFAPCVHHLRDLHEIVITNAIAKVGDGPGDRKPGSCRATESAMELPLGSNVASHPPIVGWSALEWWKPQKQSQTPLATPCLTPGELRRRFFQCFASVLSKSNFVSGVHGGRMNWCCLNGCKTAPTQAVDMLSQRNADGFRDPDEIELELCTKHPGSGQGNSMSNVELPLPSVTHEQLPNKDAQTAALMEENCQVTNLPRKAEEERDAGRHQVTSWYNKAVFSPDKKMKRCSRSPVSSFTCINDSTGISKCGGGQGTSMAVKGSVPAPTPAPIAVRNDAEELQRYASSFSCDLSAISQHYLNAFGASTAQL